MRHLLALSVTTAALAIASPAWAEGQDSATRPSPATEPTASATEAGATETAEADAPSDPSDIVVTARRRAERLTDVPVSVNVVSGDALASQGITRVDDLTHAVPALTTRPTAGRRSNSQYEIRGISTVESLITADPAVGIYVNELYRARATGTNQSFYDIDNVQVLYGPQGTLFGRNSASGAVLISTKRPTSRLEGELQASVGNLGRYETTAILNVPVTDTLSIRVAGQRIKQDGYGVNVSTGRKVANINSWSGRASVLWKPTSTIENLTVGSIYTANERGSFVYLNGFRPCPSPTAAAPAGSCSNNRAQVGSATPTIRNTIANFIANVRPTLGTFESALDSSFRDFRGDESVTSAGTTSLDPIERPRNYSLSNTTTVQLSDRLTLKNIFGYNYVKLIAANDLDGTPVKLVDTYYDTTNKTLSNELQLQGDMGNLKWVVGGLYFRERGRDIQYSIQLVTTDTRQNLLGINTSYAAYAQGTWEFLPRLSLTAGGRYTRDEREARYLNPRTINLVTGTNVCSLSPIVDTDGDCKVTDKAHFNQPTYTVSLDYKPSRDTLFYIAHRTGYRSGGLQARVALTAFGPIPGFEPEKVKDVELGFKGSWNLGDGKSVSANLALYKSWYTNLQRQVTVLTGLTAPITTTATRNAGDAHVRGFEADIAFTPVRGLTFSAFWGNVDGVYENFPTVISGVATTLRVPFATSKNSLGASVAVTPIDTAETGRVTWQTNFSYRSSFFGDQSLPFLEPESHAPPQKNLNTAIDWENIAGSNFSAQLWARNVLNNKQILGFTALATSFGVTPGILGEPRTYGATVKYRF